MNGNPWTVAKVKEELPNVLVDLGKGNVQTGRLSGRQCPFAHVSVTNLGTLHLHSHLWMDFEVAWETVAHCLNTGKPILM